ncbi:hypothetical protein HPC49_46885 [Pyxidicoccus fallax]|uniref:Lipoprotein n=1 Tax=Pyxidicoccus fallax TaxID=394095 RepID=A0A848LUG3_9BACT|nr:hypothetical protein [Pyxidicoccus fallax]NMO21657.1 hypothetical protein [Pyxidicoccus fallax]NPC85704.1 hypothetical protein [Pyxidicoccus fallax]
MKALLKYGGLLLALGASACIDIDDQPSKVHDFRVLGISTEKPELMAPDCERTPEALEVLTSEVRFRALLVDPAGGGRPIQYTLWACADVEDELCADEANRVKLAEGTTAEGELSLAIRPGAATVGEDIPLLLRVQEADPFKGLGGIRMPLVLHAVAGDEEVYAQKLMVFWCPMVEGMKENVQPVIPGLRVDDAPWTVDALPELRGEGPFVMTADDVAPFEETYVVPGLREESVTLQEAWEIAWYATFGEFSPQVTGGADLGGQKGKHRTEWEPPEDAKEAREVTFWAVVRDGRGGMSWVSRRARWSP